MHHVLILVPNCFLESFECFPHNHCYLQITTTADSMEVQLKTAANSQSENQNEYHYLQLGQPAADSIEMQRNTAVNSRSENQIEYHSGRVEMQFSPQLLRSESAS